MITKTRVEPQALLDAVRDGIARLGPYARLAVPSEAYTLRWWAAETLLRGQPPVELTDFLAREAARSTDWLDQVQHDLETELADTAGAIADAVAGRDGFAFADGCRREMDTRALLERIADRRRELRSQGADASVPKPPTHLTCSPQEPNRRTFDSLGNRNPSSRSTDACIVDHVASLTIARGLVKLTDSEYALLAEWARWWSVAEGDESLLANVLEARAIVALG